MESQCFAYGVSGAGLSCSPYYSASSFPTTMIGSSRFDSRNSPIFHFHNHYDTNNLSESTFSSNSTLDCTTYLASPFRLQDNSLINPNEPFIMDSNNHHIRHALQELETALMAADDEEEVITSQPFLREPHLPHSPTDLKQLLIACAAALHDNKLDKFDKLVHLACGSVSISGEPVQRLGTYLLEGLIARKESSGSNIYGTLNCNEPDSKDLLSCMRTLYEICPYLKFSYMAANGAIAEACKDEDYIHIIDFQIAQGTQWMTLLQALAERPSGPPRVRITGIDDQVSRYARGGGLAAVSNRFAAISKRFNISVEFHAVEVPAMDVTREMLGVRASEALAVNFPLQLHHTPDESVDVANPRDGLLRMVKSLGPKVVTLVEQESNTNTSAFLPRFVETLEYYGAMFESIDVAATREGKERIDMEKNCLGRDMVNVVACEGKERVERHEMFGKWRLRFMMAGFQQCAMSSYVNSVIRGLLKCYSENYSLVEKDGAMLLGWKDRNLISASAWH